MLAAVERRAGDGFCRRDELERDFPRAGSRDFGRGVRRAIAGGYLISRRHRGRTHLALAPEGWDLLRRR